MERTTILNLLIQVFFLEVDKWTPARLKMVGQAFKADLFPLPEDVLLNSSDGPVRADFLVELSPASSCLPPCPCIHRPGLDEFGKAKLL